MGRTKIWLSWSSGKDSAWALHELRASQDFEVARLLTEAGSPPKVLTAACHLGAERSRELFEATYDDYRRRVGVLYR